MGDWRDDIRGMLLMVIKDYELLEGFLCLSENKAQNDSSSL